MGKEKIHINIVVIGHVDYRLILCSLLKYLNRFHNG